MKFLEAQKVLKNFSGGRELKLLLAMSGTADPLDLYLRAHAANRGWDARVSHLPFGTLHQSVHRPPELGVHEVYLLMPWDLVPELDWRTGVVLSPPSDESINKGSQELLANIVRRGASVVYVDAPMPPLWLDAARNRALSATLCVNAQGAGATILPGDTFAIGSYLANGFAVSPDAFGVVAAGVILAALSQRAGSAKVLVTDLDNTLWSGIIGDDGLDGIQFRPEGVGYKHFVYQTLLKRLRADGVLLAAVTKNDDAVAREPLATGEMVLSDSDFVSIVATWEPKSIQIEALAAHLNLDISSFVFVDDNPVELAEVAARIPGIRCELFPAQEKQLTRLFDALTAHFHRTVVTSEDRERSELYQRRLESLPPRSGDASDIRDFLLGLSMELLIEDRSDGDRSRALQLINKTNQFNLNGRRVSEAELDAILRDGGRLLTATLKDRTGDHGQILAAVLTPHLTLSTMVMSCRVFQRQVEFAFMAWLRQAGLAPSAIEFAATARNTPTVTFLEQFIGGPVAEGLVSVPLHCFDGHAEHALELFSVRDLRQAP